MSKQQSTDIQIPEPALSKFLFSDTRLALVWLIIRFYVGWQWIVAGFEKITSPVWTGQQAGTALQGFLLGALKKTGGAHPDVSSWYGVFLKDFVLHQSVLFSYLVSYGEFLVGIALLTGLFTGIAAFFGGFMNMNYLFSGTVSSNPLLFLLELFLILAWRVAGWYGLDRFALPFLGTPWKPGKLFQKKHW